MPQNPNQNDDRRERQGTPGSKPAKPDMGGTKSPGREGGTGDEGQRRDFDERREDEDRR